MQSNFTSTSSAQILGNNLFRHYASIYNEGAGTLYLLLGTGTVSNTNYTSPVAVGVLYELPEGYVGPVQGIFVGAGTARVSDVSASGS